MLVLVGRADLLIDVSIIIARAVRERNVMREEHFGLRLQSVDVRPHVGRMCGCVAICRVLGFIDDTILDRAGTTSGCPGTRQRPIPESAFFLCSSWLRDSRALLKVGSCSAARAGRCVIIFYF